MWQLTDMLLIHSSQRVLRDQLYQEKQRSIEHERERAHVQGLQLQATAQEQV